VDSLTPFSGNHVLIHALRGLAPPEAPASTPDAPPEECRFEEVCPTAAD